MNANLINIDSLEALDALFADSHTAPVVLFKHSTTCGISSGVLQEISSVNGDIHMIILQTHRPLSNEIAARTGIRHESPQAIVIRNGQPVYSASHYDIEAKDLEMHLAVDVLA